MGACQIGSNHESCCDVCVIYIYVCVCVNMRVCKCVCVLMCVCAYVCVFACGRVNADMIINGNTAFGWESFGCKH
jgi:hypothetical protein